MVRAEARAGRQQGHGQAAGGQGPQAGERLQQTGQTPYVPSPSTNNANLSQRKQYDNNPRYKYDNILSMDLDAPEKTTQEFQGS